MQTLKLHIELATKTGKTCVASINNIKQNFLAKLKYSAKS